MKNVQTRASVLAVLVGGALAALGAATPPPAGTNYILHAAITASNPPPPIIATVGGMPIMPDLAGTNAYGVVASLPSGTIYGVYDMVYTNLNLCGSTFSQGDFIANIAGSLSSVGKSNTLVVNMTMKGSGYVQNSTGSTQRMANVNLSFASSGGLIASNSQVVVSSTNPVVLLESTYLGDPNALLTNNGTAYDVNTVYRFNATTNYYTNIVQSAGYQTLDIPYITETYSTSTNTGATNIISVTYNNCADACEVNFGGPIATNFILQFSCLATNMWTNWIIGTNFSVTWTQVGTNAVVAHTNYNFPIYGLSTNDLAAYIAAQTNAINLNTTGSVQFVTYPLVTNTIAASGSTNTSVTGGYVGMPAFSNGWYEVDGTLHGSITAGRCTESFAGQAASLSQSETIWTTFTGTGSITNGPYFGTNTATGVWIATNDSGVVYIYSTYVQSFDLAVTEYGNPFTGRIKQFGNNIWASTYQGFFGVGTNNFRKDRYAMTFTGNGNARGISLVVTGASGVFIDHLSSLTNIVLYTNTAAGSNAAYVASFTNNGGFSTMGVLDSVTNGIGTTNVTITRFSVCDVPPLIITNTIDCIINGIAKGRIFGQKATFGFTNTDKVIGN